MLHQQQHIIQVKFITTRIDATENSVSALLRHRGFEVTQSAMEPRTTCRWEMFSVKLLLSSY